MTFINFIIKNIKDIALIISVLNPVLYFLYSYSERRILSFKIDRYSTLISLSLTLLSVYVCFTIFIVESILNNNGYENVFDPNLWIIFIVVTIFFMFSSIIIEIIYQINLRITFTLIRTDNLSGVLIKQKTTDTHRLIKYQDLKDIFDEKEIQIFNRRIHREKSLTLNTEYKEYNYCITNATNRKKYLKVVKAKITLNLLENVTWALIILVGFVGIFLGWYCNIKEFWLCIFSVLLPILNFIKNAISIY
ncbi:hypothetical protein MTQ96_00600 [Staphylococcus agnetis]|uniref:hypothetical protein n=3 Tax=Staphylococcus agnetis TaxID=985762 RepID=UPI000D19F651|nr:hypothetical protein [Staphylococcus agnetis]MCO4356336.1 hypothetical protein [Staphylococcus agnetis]MCO4361232.1 hypothetical protein [Staphylococcus agnetis]PTH35612.1 hypothetical protein BU589_00295 [Staphylococcus agnetis]